MGKNIFQESIFLYNLIKSLNLTEKQKNTIFIAIYDLIDAIIGVNKNVA